MAKKVVLRDLKKILNKLPESALDEELFVHRPDIDVSGAVCKIRKASADLMYDFSDDPAPLMTRSALKNDRGYDKDEIAGFAVAIPKGGLYLEF